MKEKILSDKELEKLIYELQSFPSGSFIITENERNLILILLIEYQANK